MCKVYRGDKSINKVYLPRYATAEVLLSLIEDSKTATEEIE